MVWQAAGLAVLAAAIRMQYVPPALLLLGIVLLRTRDRLHPVLASVVLLFAVGVFDALTWGRGLFHSYQMGVARRGVEGHDVAERVILSR